MLGETDGRADAALRGDRFTLGRLAANLIRVEPNNLVERPWGGEWIRRFKQLESDTSSPGVRWGESFEIAAFSDDREANQYPSMVGFDDGSSLPLQTLLARHGNSILGERFVAAHGACFPLLPKILDVKELLSVQGHPAGHTEAYVIIDADPGATLRLGFSRDIDKTILGRELHEGLSAQNELIDLLGPGFAPDDLQPLVAPWLASRDLDVTSLEAQVARHFPGQNARAAMLLSELKRLYWHVLDSLNVVSAVPGRVIHNATPLRCLSTGGTASAEVHALGNPDGKEILALEIRRPGPTFRAWDNIRFPKRRVDVDLALDALNLCETDPEEFVAERREVAGRDGVLVSVDSPWFRIEHLMPDAGHAVSLPPTGPHSLHCTAGCIEVSAVDGRHIGALTAGESALVPIGVGGYHVESADAAEVVRVTIPER